MTSQPSKIIYTLTDEAPLLATYSLLPIIQTFAKPAEIEVVTSDISVAARILAEFPDFLAEGQRVPDNLAELGRLTQEPGTNIIKLPNISASIPQLTSAIKELRAKGCMIPEYPENSQTDEEKAIAKRYSKILGSAVNPVLREGNSDRRAPAAVKRYARNNPHKMGKWSHASRTHVSCMTHGDFYHGEKSMTLPRECDVKMDLVTKDGRVIVLKEKTHLLEGEIIDSMFMSKKALCEFYEEQLHEAREADILFSLHVKATMMKVSHPIVFGHAVKVFYKDLFAQYGDLFEKIGVKPNNGMSSVYDKIKTLPQAQQDEIVACIKACEAERPRLAMVDSDKGITNLHAPNDVIVDASMPAMIRDGGKMWGPDGKLHDTKAVQPESTFARIYQEMINFCKTNGAFDPRVMGTVPNVGLMAQQAEEYGSHDKTFEIPEAGEARIVDDQGNVLLVQNVEKGDIWRMCQTKDAAVKDWVKLAVTRARLSNTPAVFWLDPYRPHENELIRKVNLYLEDYDLTGVEIHLMSQLRAMRFTLERAFRGFDTISVTGNILRDYLTDLFPILELGTSAKMLSIVPLMAGGGLFETGAGGSAPKHVQQLLKENYLRWDSLGEFLALTVSFEDVAQKTGNKKAQVLADALDKATEELLENNKSPARRLGQIDNRGSHFYLAMYWAQALAAQTEDAELAGKFAPLAKALGENEANIIAELNGVQGSPVDLGGYYVIDASRISAVMRPSETFNKALASLNA
ncbi:MAG: NADP-dependent isocitrate dehydrogenase [Gammaproteobacteria bacterium]|nr:NADP-dependent isocitrate dehydrogenase [Gammaproteobacteria bacterium]MBU1722480.1 NADP-dependent isocitrate dehydrogenase [Gammaproteobacteria bacterium]MBU2005513.1 NADP-dependent isocitrate dehydrogenase [Gammaproteobacteria bacterium]